MVLLPLRRSHPRYPVQKIASYHYGGKSLLTLTLDLGLGGMKIKTHQHLCEDERLIFKLVLGRDSIQLKGRIVYSLLLPDKQSVSGVQFLDVSEANRSLLEDCLTNLNAWMKQKGMPLKSKK